MLSSSLQNLLWCAFAVYSLHVVYSCRQEIYFAHKLKKLKDLLRFGH